MTSPKASRRAVVASAVAGAAVLSAASEAAAQSGAGPGAGGTIYELRIYRLMRGGAQAQRLAQYLQAAFIPAARRAGCGPIGVFSVSTGPQSPSVYVLIPHPSTALVFDLPGRLAGDAAYGAAAEPFLATVATDPPYLSLDVKLMRSFPRFPRPEIGDTTQRRIFELRTYHSHNERAGAKKIAMFETGGEIAIFRKSGMTPVFFAQDLTGPGLPSLTYMLSYPSLAAREQVWRTFAADPDWRALSTTPGLTDPDIVASIDSLYLSPAAYSQI